MTDPDGLYAEGKVTINVVPVNDVPVAFDAVVHTAEGYTYKGKLPGYDLDEETETSSYTLSFSLDQDGSKGTATVLDAATGEFSYVPNANANGKDTFTYTVSDGTLSSVAGTITVYIQDDDLAVHHFDEDAAQFKVSHVDPTSGTTAEKKVFSGEDIAQQALSAFDTSRGYLYLLQRDWTNDAGAVKLYKIDSSDYSVLDTSAAEDYNRLSFLEVDPVSGKIYGSYHNDGGSNIFAELDTVNNGLSDIDHYYEYGSGYLCSYKGTDVDASTFYMCSSTPCSAEYCHNTTQGNIVWSGDPIADTLPVCNASDTSAYWQKIGQTVCPSCIGKKPFILLACWSYQ